MPLGFGAPAPHTPNYDNVTTLDTESFYDSPHNLSWSSSDVVLSSLNCAFLPYDWNLPAAAPFLDDFPADPIVAIDERACPPLPLPLAEIPLVLLELVV